jgi:hypothetical protein
MFELKLLSIEAIPSALEKAIRYRVLNEPEQAESICQDILRIDPDHQEALRTLILTITDQFGGANPRSSGVARELLPKLHSLYEREYYAGIIGERLAIAKLRSGVWGTGPLVYQFFHEAMQCYERAEVLRPAGHDDAILRWNSCARMIMNHPQVRPEPTKVEMVPDLGE